VASKKLRKVLERTLSGRSDANLSFGDLIALLLALGFEERARGDHHILWKAGITEIINLQPKGSKAKPYQVKQVRVILAKYNVGFTSE
jgi:HicA toxin of bacterial toxin-antitoxin,